VGGQVQHGLSLRWGQAGRDGDEFASQGGTAGFGEVPPTRAPAARSRFWAIAAHSTQAEFAPKRPDGMWANGPSIRSANTVSMIA
jgi:hypothetical protein